MTQCFPVNIDAKCEADEAIKRRQVAYYPCALRAIDMLLNHAASSLPVQTSGSCTLLIILRPYRSDCWFVMFWCALVCHLVVVTGICVWAGVASRYGLDGPVIESLCRRYFQHRSDRPWGPPRLLYNAYWVIPVTKAKGMALTTYPI